MNKKHRVDTLEMYSREIIDLVVTQWTKWVNLLLTWEEAEILAEHIVQSCESITKAEDFFRCIPPPILEKLMADTQFRIFSQRLLPILRQLIKT